MSTFKPFTMLRRAKMAEKKQTVFKSPDLQKMQAVVINHRTKIYIPVNADPEEAKKRYLSRLGFKKP